jgi:hypothetical protein
LWILGLWQAGTELLRTSCVDVPKKGINLRGPTWEQFLWDQAGGFYLGYENFIITWRYLQGSSIACKLLLMISSVCKKGPTNYKRGGAHPGAAVDTLLCQ